MTDQNDPRILVAELEDIETRVRRYRSLSVRLGPYANQPITKVELYDEVPVRKTSWMGFFGSSTKGTRVEVASLDQTERRMLAEALRVMADKEATKAKALAARIGTTTKVS